MFMFDDYLFLGALNLIPKNNFSYYLLSAKLDIYFPWSLNLYTLQNKVYYPEKLFFSELELKSNLKIRFLIRDIFAEHKLLETLL